VVAGLGMKTNLVSFSSGYRDTFLSALFDRIAGSRNEFLTDGRNIVKSDLFIVTGVD